MPPMYLLGRYIDPMLGVFTGVLAYQLHETNPRSRPVAGHSLRELVEWRWAESRELRRKKEESLMLQERAAGKESEWEKLQATVMEELGQVEQKTGKALRS